MGGMGDMYNADFPSRKNDYKYRAIVSKHDRPPKVDISESIKETRRIYSDMDNDKFCAWYSKRYRIPIKAVQAVINNM